MTRFISIASGKGGVGKTTTAINLGSALTDMGKQVIVIDGNLSTPHIGLSLGASKIPLSIHQVLRGKGHISEAVYKHNSGLMIIPGSISLQDLEDINRNRLADTILDLYGKTEFVLIDSPAGISGELFDALRSSDELLMVSTPDILSSSDALKLKKNAESLGIKTLGVVLNKVAGLSSELSPENVEALIESPVLSIIPEDTHFIHSMKQKQPVVFAYPEAPSTRAYKQLALSLLGEKERFDREKNYCENKREGFLKSLFRRYEA